MVAVPKRHHLIGGVPGISSKVDLNRFAIFVDSIVRVVLFSRLIELQTDGTGADQILI